MKQKLNKGGFKVVGGNTGLIHARLYPSKLWSAALRGLTEEGCLDHNFDCFTEFCLEMFFLCPPDETWINNVSLANYLVLTRAGCAEGTLSLFKVLSGVSYVVSSNILLEWTGNQLEAGFQNAHDTHAYAHSDGVTRFSASFYSPPSGRALFEPKLIAFFTASHIIWTCLSVLQLNLNC